MASSSWRNFTVSASDWVSFPPYNDEKSRINTSDGISTKTQNNLTRSESDGWPMDEIMHDVEQQRHHAVVGMERQFENIEVILSESRNRQRDSKRTSFQSRLPPPLKRKTSYISIEEEDDYCINEYYEHEFSKNDNLSSREHSAVRVLQQQSEFKREQSDGSFPFDLSKLRETPATTSHVIVSPSRIQQSPSYSRSKARVPVSSLSSSSPQESTKRGNSMVRSQLPTPVGDRAGSLSNLDYGKTKIFQSSFTSDESASSDRSTPSNGAITESEETCYPEKSNLSRKIKWFLVILAFILVVSISVLLGLWAREKSYAKNGLQASQDPQSDPIGGTTEENFINRESNTNGIETETPQATANTYDDSTSTVEEDFKDWYSENADTILSLDEPNEVAPELGYDYTANTDFLVGVYYYPWHGESFHNGGGYMRKDLVPQHIPSLGEYNDSDPRVIAHHMKWFRQANIGLLVTSWWGPNRLEDSNTKDVIMNHDHVGNLKIALHYETTNRLGDGQDKLPNARTDIKYMCENYFDHSNYYKIDGRPVLFIYISRKLDTLGTLEEALLTMRSTASKCGHNVYLIGDAVFESAPDPSEPHVPFWYFDAVTNYDVYGSSGRPEGHVGTGGVDNYYRQQTEWRKQALRDECRYIPAVSPGYNDRGVRMEKDHPPLSRRITSSSLEGSLFHYQLKQAKELVDRKVDNMILVNSFNEWHEDTQIEPVIGNPSTRPFNFTKGLEYVGYGELYLDILGAATSSDKTQHNKFDYLL